MQSAAKICAIAEPEKSNKIASAVRIDICMCVSGGDVIITAGSARRQAGTVLVGSGDPFFVLDRPLLASVIPTPHVKAVTMRHSDVSPRALDLPEAFEEYCVCSRSLLDAPACWCRGLPF